jgi:hypothetical protein
MSQNAETMSMKQFFEKDLPRQFAAQIAANPPENLEGEEYRLNYQVENEKYGLLLCNGTQLEVVPGGVADPLLDITLTPSSMNDVIADGLKPGDPLLAYNNRQKLDKLKTVKGLLKMQLTRDDGTLAESATIFNGVSEPTVTVKAKVSDYAAISEGKMNGQLAMITGKLKFEGSLPFLMLLSSLNQ